MKLERVELFTTRNEWMGLFYGLSYIEHTFYYPSELAKAHRPPLLDYDRYRYEFWFKADFFQEFKAGLEKDLRKHKIKYRIRKKEVSCINKRIAGQDHAQVAFFKGKHEWMKGT